MLERKLTRLAIAIGAAVWFVRLMVSRAERDKVDAAMQALDAASFRARGIAMAEHKKKHEG